MASTEPNGDRPASATPDKGFPQEGDNFRRIGDVLAPWAAEIVAAWKVRQK